MSNKLLNLSDEFVDPRIYDLANSFIQKEFLNTQKEKDFYLKNLTKYFYNIKIEDLNRDFLTVFLSDVKLTSHGEIYIINRFILFLIENCAIKELSYLLIFKPIVYKKRFFIDSFINLLKIDFNFFNTFDEKYIIKHLRTFIALNNINLNDVKFKDEALKKSLSKYFYNLKCDTNLVIFSRLNKCIFCKSLIKDLFANINKKDINKKFIYNLLIKNKSKLYKKGANIFLDLLIFLIDDNLIVDEELKKILKFKKTRFSFRFANLIDLFSSTNIDMCYIVNFEDYNIFYYINIDSEEIRNIALDYIYFLEKRDTHLFYIFKNFNESLGTKYEIKTVEDLNFNTFKNQLIFFKNNMPKVLNSFVKFYIYIKEKYNKNIFENDNINPMILYRNDLPYVFENDFTPINYNPFEDVPKEDKWILFYPNDINSNSNTLNFKGAKLDFSTIKEKKYRFWLKEFFWKSNGLNNKIMNFGNYKNFFNFISDIKSGKETYLYAGKTHDLTIKISEIYAYKQMLKNKYKKNSTINMNLSNARSVLTYVDNNIEKINPSILYSLDFMHKRKNPAKPKAIPDNELNKLYNFMKENSKHSVKNALFFSIFHIGLITEFRISQITSLKVNCIKETTKKNEYVILSKTKVSNGEIVEQPITTFAKKQLDEIIKLTKIYRDSQNVDNSIKDYIFIYKTQKRQIAVITPQIFNKYLHKCCDKLNLPRYNFENIRDTHMTKAEEFVINNSLSNINQKILTGHKSLKTDNHYVDTSVTEILESVHGVVIGDVNLDIKNKVVENLSTDLTKKENEVSNNCGYCSANDCNNYTYLDCLLCKYFITTVDKISFFEDQIKILNHKIQNATLKHDKEDLVNIKTILVKYLEKLIILKERM